MELQVKDDSTNLFVKFKQAFVKYYSIFEKEFEVEMNIIPLKSDKDNNDRMTIEFQFSKKMKDLSSGKPENCSKKDFSKGKKVVYVMCLILAINSIESVG